MAATTIDRARVRVLLAAEQAAFGASHPRSAALAERAAGSLLGGVPMNWMRRWSGGHPVFVASAAGAEVVDVDGHRLVDLCLGDTGAMTGHGPAPTLAAIERQARDGITTMLPTADAVDVGEELQRRFGLPSWQMAMTATDANRFALRLARQITGRRKVLVFNWCYHGTVDEALVVLGPDGVTAVPRPGSIGAPVAPHLTTAVVEFNDVLALEQVLARRDIAAVLAEPALTNIGIVHPEPGFHDALRAVTRDTGTLLILDETHTICTGPGGYTGAHRLEPDLLTIGKPIAGGVPAAAFGMSAAVAERAAALTATADTDVSGIGGTLAGNALAVAAMRATLRDVLTDAAYARMIPLADRWAGGVADVIARAGLDWHVNRLGCRAEYWFGPPPRNGGQAAAAVDHELEAFLHAWALNRGVLLTPFHNMALMSPATTAAHVDRHTEVFDAAVAALLAP